MTKLLVTGWVAGIEARQVEVAQNVLRLIEAYDSDQSSRAAYDAACRAYVTEVAASFFGSRFLSLIGRILVQQADIYRTSTSPWSWFPGAYAVASSWFEGWQGSWNMVVTGRRAYNDFPVVPERVKKDQVDTSGVKFRKGLQHVLSLVIDPVWSFVSLDVADTLRGACWRILSDTSVDSAERQRRAEALRILGQALLREQVETCVDRALSTAVIKERIGLAIEQSSKPKPEAPNDSPWPLLEGGQVA